MIDIKVPALDAVYDFFIAEEVTIAVLIEELTELICQREKLDNDADENLFSLYVVATGQALDREKTLAHYGIDTGCQLLLV